MKSLLIGKLYSPSTNHIIPFPIHSIYPHRPSRRLKLKINWHTTVLPRLPCCHLISSDQRHRVRVLPLEQRQYLAPSSPQAHKMSYLSLVFFFPCVQANAGRIVTSHGLPKGSAIHPACTLVTSPQIPSEYTSNISWITSN